MRLLIAVLVTVAAAAAAVAADAAAGPPVGASPTSVIGACCSTGENPFIENKEKENLPCVDAVGETECLTRLHGVFLGAGSKCAPNLAAVCTRVRGACCSAAGAHASVGTLPYSECKAAGNVFAGFGKSAAACAGAGAANAILAAAGVAAGAVVSGGGAAAAAVGGARDGKGQIEGKESATASDNALHTMLSGRVFNPRKPDAVIYPGMVNLVSSRRVRVATTRVDTNGEYKFAFTRAEYDRVLAQKSPAFSVVMSAGKGVAEQMHEDGNEKVVCVADREKRPDAIAMRDLVVSDVATRNIAVACARVTTRTKREALASSSSSSELDSDSDSDSSSFSDVFASTTSDFSSSDFSSLSSDSDTDTDESTSDSSSSDGGSHHGRRRHREGKSPLGTTGSVIFAILLLCCCVGCAVFFIAYPGEAAAVPVPPEGSPPGSSTKAQFKGSAAAATERTRNLFDDMEDEMHTA